MELTSTYIRSRCHAMRHLPDPSTKAMSIISARNRMWPRDVGWFSCTTLACVPSCPNGCQIPILRCYPRASNLISSLSLSGFQIKEGYISSEHQSTDHSSRKSFFQRHAGYQILACLGLYLCPECRWFSDQGLDSIC